MASSVLSFCCLIFVTSLAYCREGAPLKLSLGFTALSPPKIIALRNQPLLLNCSGYSEEGPLRISWRHEDADIRDRQLVTYPNGSLLIERAAPLKKRDRRWDGNYTCLLRNSVAILVSRPIHVVLARMSKSFTYEPQPLATYEGGPARFSCQINAVPPAAISWYKDGIELPQNDSRYTILPSGTLQITKVSLSDAGNYRCRCVNVIRQRVSSDATLTVLQRTEPFQPPVFLSSGETVYAVKNEPAVLECIADGFPKIELSWKRKDGKSFKEQFLGFGNLYFPKVQPEDSGSYMCVVKSVHHETSQIVSATQKITLTVYVPPKFTKVPVSQIIPTSQTVRFDCEVEGIPASSIIWMKDGEPLYINGRIKLKPKNTLIVSQTVTTDSGIYQCVASNVAGVNTAAARLQVNASSDQPQPPSGLVAHTMSSTSIILKWNPVPSPAISPIQAYTVHYVPTHGGLEQDTVAVNTSLLIDRLKPFTNYTFYVRAYNNKSASEPSKSVIQMTGEDVPLIAPKISLTSISPTTLHLQWNELPIEKARGVITSHRIYYRKHKQASYSVRDSDTATEYTITGLTPKLKYDVRVLSGTKAGFPVLADEAWPWVLYEMPDVVTAMVPLSPVLHLTVINTTALKVEWSMPDENTYPVEGFYLSYRQHNHPLKQRNTVPANTTKFLLFNLAPQSWYEVHLVAYNANGESTESVRNIITVSGDNPDVETVEVVEPPHQLEAEPTSSSSIHLTWETPRTSRNISYYTVRYHPVFTSGLVNESSINYLRSTNNEVTITDLQPFTLYEFSVRSHDSHKRQGPFSQKVECKTDEDLPSAPLELSWTPIDANSVRLNWQAPKYPNGIIFSYRILYSMNIENMNKDLWTTKDEKGTVLTSIINGLSSNTLYYFCMKSKNRAGLSPPTPTIVLNIPVRHNNSRMPSQEMFDAEPPDPFLGVVLGLSIGVGCIIICAVIIICRNRCCPPPPPPVVQDRRYSACCGNGYVPQVNGHVIGEKRDSNVDCHEMECFTPMLNQFSNGETDRHLDTKGGYPTSTCNGRANGHPHQLLGNSRSSLDSHQGSVGSAQASIQDDHTLAKQSKRYSTKDSKIPESNWHDSPGDVTSSTVLLSDDTNQSKSNDDKSLLWDTDLPHGANSNAEAESSCNKDFELHAEKDEEHVPSVASQEESSSLPFSVNAFPSPLTTPKFSQPIVETSQDPT